jgi:O-antigen/teichoic acid export membrane protein
MYLLLNMGLAAVAGFAFWAICTRLYPAEEIGYATALFGALGLATSLSNLGMSRTVVRFLGSSKMQARDLVSKLSLVALGATVFGIVLSFFLGAFGIEHSTANVMAIFIATVLFMSVKLLFDNVFIALKSASGTLVENIAFSAVKLVLPLLTVSLGFLGIFSAQLAAAVAAVIVSVLLLRRKHSYRFLTKPSRESMRGKWSFAFGSYSSDIIGSLPANILPIIVVSKLGPVPGALWYIAMLMINLLLAVSSSINQAMFAEISNATGSIWGYVKKASKAMYGLVTPLAILVAVFAPQILAVFGEQYVEAAPTLRIMSLFALIGIANYITGSILAYYKKVLYITLVNVVNASIVGIYCLLFATDLQGIVVAWVLGEIANVLLFVGGCWYFVRKSKGAAVGKVEA